MQDNMCLPGVQPGEKRHSMCCLVGAEPKFETGLQRGN